MTIDYHSKDPIMACSSGATSPVGIAVLRFTGFNCFDEFESFLSFKSNRKRVARRAELVDIKAGSKTLDQAIYLPFFAPYSFSGENMAELHVHGNPLNVNRILALFEKLGFRYAAPGEFSYRALRNKKLNLNQIEGLDLLIHADSKLALDQGLELLDGELAAQYQELHQNFLNTRMHLEVLMDFSDDVGEEKAFDNFRSSFKATFGNLKSLESRCRTDINLLRPSIVVFGKPNHGKSTFFNHVLGQERALVFDKPGTTRDFISEAIVFDENKFHLFDTAGLREASEDEIELLGVEKAKKVISESFFRVHVVSCLDPEVSFCGEEPDLVLFTHFDLLPEGFNLDKALKSARFVVFVDQKNKFKSFHPLENKEFFERFGSIGADDSSGSIGPKFSKTGPMGPESLIEMEISAFKILKILALAKFKELSSVNPLLLNRHRGLILEGGSIVEQISQVINNTSDLAIIDNEINRLAPILGELVGLVSPDDVLNHLFANFCIGK